MRDRWRWDASYLPPLVLLNEPASSATSAAAAMVPKEAEPDKKYLADRIASLKPLLENLAATYGLTRRPEFTGIGQYKDLFVNLPPPRIIPCWHEDKVFAYQRLAGVNPLSLRRLDEIPSNIWIEDGRLAPFLPPGRTLKEEIAAGHIFCADYSILDGIAPATDGSGTRYVMPVIGLFRAVADPADGVGLAPLAIQLGAHRNAKAVFTPTDGRAWLIAKMAFQCADLNFVEMGPHLLWAHFMPEPFAVATMRQLSVRHPVSVLLAPHFRVLVWNNFEGRELLVRAGGTLAELLGGGLGGSLEILRRAFTGRGRQPGFNTDVWDLPKDIASRGLDKLPSYPYRDDGMLLWNAIASFVDKYLRHYYGGDDDNVIEDYEIQAWARDLSSPDGAYVPGVPSSFTGIETLAHILTRLIFGCGPFHSAINFAQYEYMAYPPNMPGALFAPLPPDLRALSNAELDALILNLLPPPSKSKIQMQTVFELTSYHWDILGHYPASDFVDPAAQKIIAEFQRALADAEMVIAGRNRDRGRRPLPYDYLLPSNVLNSPSI